MFTDTKKIYERIRALERDLYNEVSKFINDRLDKFVECEVCGCLLDGRKAIKGASKIVEEAGFVFGTCIERIVKTHYCKLHAPQETKEQL